MNRKKKAVSKESYVILLLTILVFTFLSKEIGSLGLLFKIIMATAHDLLLNTVFLILSISVLAGAFSAILCEFGVVGLLNQLISPVIGPIYGLPGASSLGIITTYLSDNPAIIALAKDDSYKGFFEPYQLPALTNLGTSFGMGLILSAYMLSLAPGGEFIRPVLLGNLGAIIGSIFSVRIMLYFSKKELPKQEGLPSILKKGPPRDREIRDGSILQRFIEATLDSGASGVEIGLSIIPGVLTICSAVMILTFGPAGPSGEYLGVAFEGIELLPKIGEKLSFILNPLFGFTSPEAIAFPITSLGSVGAAMGISGTLLKDGLIGPLDIAVFTAMGMTWSGYLSTHIAMMNALGHRKLTNKAILAHTIGGLIAGVAAHLLMLI